jgi:hypothetical protein
MTADRFDGSLGVLGRRHLDEAKPTGSAAVTIGDDLGVDNLAVLAKDHPEIVCAGVGSEIADVKIAGHRRLFRCNKPEVADQSGITRHDDSVPRSKAPIRTGSSMRDPAI